MAKCGGCGAESSRTRTRFNQQHDVIGEECDKCTRPDSFDPQWKTAKPAMGWEAYPEKYIRKENPQGGWMYVAKDEFRQDTLDKLQSAEKREEAKYAEALEKKRRNRRLTPMTQAEIEQTLNRVRPAMEHKAEAEKQEKERARDAWLI